MRHKKSRHKKYYAFIAIALFTSITQKNIQAQDIISEVKLTDIADEPLITQTIYQPKPNLMIIKDDSSSMSRTYMPDELGSNRGLGDREAKKDWIGYYSSQCNGLAYDPDYIYHPPLNANNASYAPSNFNAAKSDGFSNSTQTSNLGSSEHDFLKVTINDSGHFNFNTTNEINLSSNIASTLGKKSFIKDDVVHLKPLSPQNFYFKSEQIDGFPEPVPVIKNEGSFSDRKTIKTTIIPSKIINEYTFSTSSFEISATVIENNSPQKIKINPTSISYTSTVTVTTTTTTTYREEIVTTDRSGSSTTTTQQKTSTSTSTSTKRLGDISLEGWKNNISKKGNWQIKFSGQIYYSYSGIQPRMGWKYNAASEPLKDTTFYKECSVAQTASAGTSNSGVFELNVVSSNSPERQNYANWYTYYRSRDLMLRTSMGHALSTLDESYRVGFMTINKTNLAQFSTSSDDFRHVQDFNANNKEAFYKSLYQTKSESNSTPLKKALSTAGRYFAKDLSESQQDPMQYACQRNFALLTTDGYWNGDGESRGNGFGLKNTQIKNSDKYTDGIDTGKADKLTTSPYTDNYSGTLADIAHYYYTTDLRNTVLNNCTSSDQRDLCENIVPPLGNNTASHQHMITYTIGMGLVGTKSRDEPLDSITWPEPVADKITAVDDLWHAAINGRGENYAAQNSSELTQAIQSIVKAVQESLGAGSATSTNSLDLVAGNENLAFESSYTTGYWFGDVIAKKMNGGTADLSADPVWSAGQKLDAMLPSNRKIYFKRDSETSEFIWENIKETSLETHFTNLCSSLQSRLTQCQDLNEDQKDSINNGRLLIDYLRGDRSQEAAATNSRTSIFRERRSVLGDIINSKPIHVANPSFDYNDLGYKEFKESKINRKSVVYVGANDGMLHAFDAATGEEIWAYIPTAVMPNLHHLADIKYGTSKPHTYFVDGKTVQGDVKINGVWKTILVGGLNKGGRSYYALDITEPTNPSVLWEFSNDNLGLSYSDPIITKLRITKNNIPQEKWIVAFGSGYNNINPGHGKGSIFLVDVENGNQFVEIETPAGSKTNPSGLSKVNVWINSPQDNTAQRFYAGDLLGNVWRFDLDKEDFSKGSAFLLAEMKDAAGNPQPITTEPKLREYQKQSIVVIATGRYLGRSDIKDTENMTPQTQSVAAIKDNLDSKGWGNIRLANSTFKNFTITINDGKSSGIASDMNWSDNGGWRVDLPNAGERIATSMEWDGSRLIAATIIPNGDMCQSGGSSWLYSFNLSDGKSDGIQFNDNALIVGFTVIRNNDGSPKILVRASNNSTTVQDGTGFGSKTKIQPPRRISWRELP